MEEAPHSPSQEVMAEDTLPSWSWWSYGSIRSSAYREGRKTRCWRVQYDGISHLRGLNAQAVRDAALHHRTSSYEGQVSLALLVKSP
jgi:hypothetical protein